MPELRRLIAVDPALALTIGGFAIGLAFGWIVARTNFCTLGAVADWRTLGDTRRLLSWALAVAVAIAGVSLLEAGGLVPFETSIYTGAHLNWAGSLIGGGLFGIGMVYAGGCPSRSLVAAGGGDLRALVVLLVIGLAGYMTLGGVLGPVRASLEQATSITLAQPSQRLGDLLGVSNYWIAFAAAVILLGPIVAKSSFRTSHQHVFGGLGVGLAVVAGWALTGLTYDEMSAAPRGASSLSFVKPTGDTLEWLQRATALGWPGFGVGSVAGTLAGSLLAHVMARRFAVTGYRDSADQKRSLAGAVLMGIGGVTGLGCSVGQGITGVSTLAVGSLLAASAIVGGAVLGLKLLERGLAAD